MGFWLGFREDAWPSAGRRWTLALAGMSALLAGCTSLGAVITPPPANPAIDQQLSSLKADSTALFTGLQSAAPGCSLDANKATETKVQGELAQLQTLATADKNTHIQAGAADLAADLQNLDKAFADGASGTAGCLPAPLLSAKQTQFELSVDSLTKFQQKLK